MEDEEFLFYTEHRMIRGLFLWRAVKNSMYSLLLLLPWWFLPPWWLLRTGIILLWAYLGTLIICHVFVLVPLMMRESPHDRGR